VHGRRIVPGVGNEVGFDLVPRARSV